MLPGGQRVLAKMRGDQQHTEQPVATDTDQDLLAQKLAQYREKGVSKVKLGLTDIDGVIRGKYVNVDKFASLMEKLGGFCDCVFGWDVDDQLYDASEYTGWHTGFPDTAFRLLVETERWLPDENCPYFVGEFVGTPTAVFILFVRAPVCNRCWRNMQTAVCPCARLLSTSFLYLRKRPTACATKATAI